jgi:conjugal transfer mating pair stabilization protein TraG
LLAALTAGGTIDGRAVAAQHGVGVKNAAVKISHLHSAMEPVIAAVAEVARELGLPKPVITSGNDSSHKQGSLHFKDRALDFRGNTIQIAQGKALAARVSMRVGGDYDVIFETFANKANNHLHVEFDPD